MKKSLMFLPFLFLMSCANIDAEKEAYSAENHSFTLSTPTNQKTHVLWNVTLENTYEQENLVMNLNEYGYIPNQKMNLNEEALKQFAKELALDIDTPMINASLSEDGNIIPGRNRVILSEKELVEKVLNLTSDQTKMELPIYVTEPNIKEEDIIGIKEASIGSYTTYFDASVLGRSQNILLSADAIDSIILGPGDRFSFNEIVGERTVERGYQEAMEIVNKEFVMGIGGGICQTSSTLFNAIENAGLEIIERYTHSREIGYVPEGRDATVSWGGPDFKFQNSLPYPVLIIAKVEAGQLTIEVTTQEKNV
ncbi:VanW family protein [Alkalihalobacillus trypoxylicola]|uniref:Vancomycin resistance protein n=1 Tax=Alkalihalobacillus trypoxylicola TaxID=519424 RepID=A0A161PIQ0_9BACI|nr:VanW family protein [Alkalihalobacillus trypoxylicola]KYG33152.1 vancomycin resistance protein [Alkalihalobacillus trypoxylicola]GAF65351.1 hypothetical protein BTS2_2249 [Bacillus sp. TS-2]